jgi:hypothetical protein
MNEKLAAILAKAMVEVISQSKPVQELAEKFSVPKETIKHDVVLAMVALENKGKPGIDAMKKAIHIKEAMTAAVPKLVVEFVDLTPRGLGAVIIKFKYQYAEGLNFSNVTVVGDLTPDSEVEQMIVAALLGFGTAIASASASEGG